MSKERGNFQWTSWTRRMTTPSTPFCFRSVNVASQQTSGYWQRSRKRTAFWLKSAMRKFKTHFKLVKSCFLKFIRPWLWMAARSKNRAVTCGGSSRLSPRRKSKKPLSRRVCPAVTSGEECGLLCWTAAGKRAYNFAGQNIFIIAQNVV